MNLYLAPQSERAHPFSSVYPPPRTCSSCCPPLSPAPTPWETPCPLEPHLDSGGDRDAGNGQEGPRRRGVASKPPHCGPNYHLASDRLVITGARGWKEEREEERGGRAPHPNTYRSVPPSGWGALWPAGRSGRMLGGVDGRGRRQGAGTHGRIAAKADDSVPAWTLLGVHVYSGMRIQNAQDGRV